MTAIINFFTENFWATCTVLAALVITLTGWINAQFSVKKKIWKQVISWTLSIGLTTGTYFLGLVNMGEPVWLSIILTGAVVGLSSNGIYEISVIKSLVNNTFKKLLGLKDEIEDEKNK